MLLSPDYKLNGQAITPANQPERQPAIPMQAKPLTDDPTAERILLKSRPQYGKNHFKLLYT